MKSKILTIGIFLITAAVVGLYPVFNKHLGASPHSSASSPINPPDPVTALLADDQPRIQLAILLDTSNSMDGLIDQARNQLWEVVNEFAKSKRDGVIPTLEVAVYEYGNNKLSPESGHIRQVTSMTTELDQVSEALFSLTTDGGNEYCGFAINTAVNELNWSQSDGDIKTIFIAGNEPFSQGPVAFHAAISAAKEKGVVVNTIHAGDYQTGIATGWQNSATLAGGEYMNIDHNHQIVHINAPQDSRLAELNAQLNQSYVPYGKEGKNKLARQAVEDKKSEEISTGLMAKRTASKASSLYNNSSWDLVDAVENEEIELEDIEPKHLPKEMRNMDKDDQKQYILGKSGERKKLKEEISSLSQAREEYVATAETESAVSTIDEAIIKAVRKQGEGKNYAFEKNKK